MTNAGEMRQDIQRQELDAELACRICAEKFTVMSGEYKLPRTVVVRVLREALCPLLTAVFQFLVIFQCHRTEIDCPIQPVGYVRIREHFLMELVDDAEE